MSVDLNCTHKTHIQPVSVSINRRFKAGQVVSESVSNSSPMIVRSNKKVMVLFISNNLPNDPFLMTLLPNDNLANDWSVEPMGGMTSHAVLLSEREGADSVKVCSKGSCSSPRWRATPFGKWVWSKVSLGTGQDHVTVEGDARMAVYVFGGKHRHGYGTAGVCAEGMCMRTRTVAHMHALKDTCIQTHTHICILISSMLKPTCHFTLYLDP